MGLFFFYPNLSEFLCNRFRKGAHQTAWTKEIFYLWACAAFPYHASRLIIYENCLLGSLRKRKETIETTMYNQT